MTYVLNPFTSEFDYYVGTLTGTEIVTLLEALASGSRLSHDDGLSDVSADDHHAQSHGLASAYHTVSGLTTGHFLKATGATTFAFAAHGLTYSDVGAEVSGAVTSHESTYNHANYVTAYGWGDHASGGYALQSVLGTSIDTGLLLTTTVLSVSAILQKYHAIDPTANVQSLLGAADYAAMMALLSGTATGAFSLNSQNLTSVGTIGCGDITITGDYLLVSGSGGGTTIQLTDSGADSNPAIEIANDAVEWKLQVRGVSSDNFRIARDSETPYLVIDTSGNVDIVSHDAATVGLKLGGTPVTASAAEVNLNDGASYGANDSGGVGFRAIKVPNL